MAKVPNYYHYYLCENQEVVRVRSKLKPSATTRPSSGTWVISEWIPDQKRWCVTAEITWGRLKQLTYIGKAAQAALKNEG